MDGTGSGVSEQGIGKINQYRKNSIKEELMATTMLTWSGDSARSVRGGISVPQAEEIQYASSGESCTVQRCDLLIYEQQCAKIIYTILIKLVRVAYEENARLSYFS